MFYNEIFVDILLKRSVSLSHTSARGGCQRFTRGDHFDLLEKRIFLFSNFLFSNFLFFYLGLFFETIHEPLRLEEGTLAEDDSGLPCP